MTTAEMINRIIAKLHPQSDVVFVKIIDFDVTFTYAHNLYRCYAVKDCIRVLHLQDGVAYQVGYVTQHSAWVEGVLNGLTRNDAGEHVKEVKNNG